MKISETNKFVKTIILTSTILAIVLSSMYLLEYFLNPPQNKPLNGKIGGYVFTWGHLVKNNRYGFRERNFQKLKPEGIYRIMVLGDSLTWGVGLDVNQRYTAITEKLLNQSEQLNQLLNGSKFEVLNFGIPGGPTIRERDVLFHLKSIVDPDLIVVGFCLNDPKIKSESYSVEKEQFNKLIITQMVLKISKGLTHIRLPYWGGILNMSYFKFAEKIGIIPTWVQSMQRSYEIESVEWEYFIRALTDIKGMSDELNLDPPIFSILNQPVYSTKPTNYRSPDKRVKQYIKWFRQAQEAAEKIGFIAYHHENEISEQLQDEILTINEWDGHPSENLHRVYGEKLFRVIEQQLIDASGESV